MRDLTEQKQAEEALKKSEAQLRHANKMEAVGQLAGGIAHDFNNLLTAILGFAEVSLRRAAADDQMREPRRSRSSRAGRGRGAGLTRQLLAFSRQQMLRAAGARPEQRASSSVQTMLGRVIGEHIDVESGARRRSSAGYRPTRASSSRSS